MTTLTPDSTRKPTAICFSDSLIMFYPIQLASSLHATAVSRSHHADVIGKATTTNSGSISFSNVATVD
jgi:hypothetical protein